MSQVCRAGLINLFRVEVTKAKRWPVNCNEPLTRPPQRRFTNTYLELILFIKEEGPTYIKKLNQTIWC